MKGATFLSGFFFVVCFGIALAVLLVSFGIHIPYLDAVSKDFARSILVEGIPEEKKKVILDHSEIIFLSIINGFVAVLLVIVHWLKLALSDRKRFLKSVAGGAGTIPLGIFITAGFLLSYREAPLYLLAGVPGIFVGLFLLINKRFKELPGSLYRRIVRSFAIGTALGILCFGFLILFGGMKL